MDLGALICTPKNPHCSTCPLQRNCQAFGKDLVNVLPEAKPKKTLPTRSTQFLLLGNENQELLLQKRPPTGIWGGLWSFPQCSLETDIEDWCQQQFAVLIEDLKPLPSFRHTFSHFHLQITPIQAKIKQNLPTVMADNQTMWYNLHNPASIGLATPVKRLLDKLKIPSEAS